MNGRASELTVGASWSSIVSNNFYKKREYIVLRTNLFVKSNPWNVNFALFLKYVNEWTFGKVTSILHVRFLRNISPQWKERKYFLVSALRIYYIINSLINIINCFHFYLFLPILEARTEIKKIIHYWKGNENKKICFWNLRTFTYLGKYDFIYS